MTGNAVKNGKNALFWALTHPAIGRWSVVLAVVFSAGVLWQQNVRMQQDLAELKADMRVVRQHVASSEAEIRALSRRVDRLEGGG